MCIRDSNHQHAELFVESLLELNIKASQLEWPDQPWAEAGEKEYKKQRALRNPPLDIHQAVDWAKRLLQSETPLDPDLIHWRQPNSRFPERTTHVQHQKLERIYRSQYAEMLGRAA